MLDGREKKSYTVAKKGKAMAMLIQCKDENPKNLAAYMDGEYGRALYLYIDLLRYGCQTPGIRVYRTETEGKQTGLFLVYHGCLHCYSRNLNCAEADLAALFEAEKPHTVFFCEELFDALGYRFAAPYEEHRVKMFRAVPYHEGEPVVLEEAKDEELDEVTRFLRQNEEYASLYTHEELCAQLRERLHDGYGRCFIARENGRIIFHAATMAEEFPIAMGGMVLLDPSKQGQGQGRRYFSAMYNRMMEKGFTIYSNNLDERAEHLHRSMGYVEETKLVKLTKNNI